MVFANHRGSMIRKIKTPEKFIDMVKEVIRIHRNGLDID